MEFLNSVCSFEKGIKRPLKWYIASLFFIKTKNCPPVPSLQLADNKHDKMFKWSGQLLNIMIIMWPLDQGYYYLESRLEVDLE